MFKILSGEKRNLLSFLVRLFLLPFSLVYLTVIYFRLLMYKIGICKQKRVEGVKIICIGNISAGGTGKTPAVAYLIKLLLRFTQKIAVVSRGYRKQASEILNDEGLLLKSIYPNVLQFQNPDRYQACCDAKNAGAEIIILDDGFSHLQLRRDVDIVLIDATRPFSCFELLPRGMLREPPSSLRRASASIITRSNQVSTKKLQHLTTKVKRFSKKNTKILLSQHKPIGFKKIFAEKSTNPASPTPVDSDSIEFSSIEQLMGKSVFLFSGIGNPTSFAETCSEIDLKIAGVKEFPDHHNYDVDDLLNINESAQFAGADILVTTSKDAVKLKKLDFDIELPIYILTIEFTLSQTEEDSLIRLVFS